MKVDFAQLLRDAWALFKGDSDLLLRIAGVFFFFPSYALVLFVPRRPRRIAASPIGRRRRKRG